MSKTIRYGHLSEEVYTTAEFILEKENRALMDYAAEVLEDPGLQVVKVGNKNSSGYALLGDILEVETDAD